MERSVALPHDHNSPTEPTKRPNVSTVSVDVGGKLRLPELHIRRRRRRLLASMSMPEATVNENGQPESWQDQVRRAWQVSTIQSKTISHPVQHPAHHEFRTSILWSYASHQSGTFFRRQCVHSLAVASANRVRSSIIACDLCHSIRDRAVPPASLLTRAVSVIVRTPKPRS